MNNVNYYARVFHVMSSILVFSVATSNAMENEFENVADVTTGFDLESKQFYIHSVPEAYYADRQLLTDEINAARIINKLLAIEDATEQRHTAQVLKKHVGQDCLRRLAQKRNMGATLLLIDVTDLMDGDQQQCAIFMQIVENSITMFHKKNESIVKTLGKITELKKVIDRTQPFERLYKNLEIKDQLVQYAEVTQSPNGFHNLALLQGLSSLDMQDNTIVQPIVFNKESLEQAAIYWEKAFACSTINEEQKQKMQKEYAFLNHTLGVDVYYESDPEKAKKYLNAAVLYAPKTITKMELAFLLLFPLTKKSSAAEKKWAQEFLDEIALNPQELEEYAIVFRNMAFAYEFGREEWGVDRDADSAKKYWKILSDASFAHDTTKQLQVEAWNYYANHLAKRYLNDHVAENSKQENVYDEASAETYYKKVIASGDTTGYLGLGLCPYWKGFLDLADNSFSKVLTEVSEESFDPSRKKEINEAKALAFWCKGTIAFQKGNRSSAIMLMCLAFEKLSVLERCCFYENTRFDIFKDLCEDAHRCYAAKSTDVDDIRLIYCVARFYCVQPKLRELGFKYLDYAAQQNYNWAQLYLGACSNFNIESANKKAALLLGVPKVSDMDRCYAQAQTNLKIFSSWGILTAVLGVVKQNWQDGLLDEWLNNTVNFHQFVYEYLFNNLTEDVNSSEILNDVKLYDYLMTQGSVGARILKTMILMNSRKLEEGLKIGEKLLPELKKISSQLHDNWEKFLIGACTHRALIVLHAPGNKQTAAASMKDFCYAWKKGNQAASIGVAVLVLSEKIEPDTARQYLKEQGIPLNKKDSVKKYAQVILDKALQNVAQFDPSEQMMTSHLLRALAGYYLQKNDKNNAEKYATISRELGNELADVVLDATKENKILQKGRTIAGIREKKEEETRASNRVGQRSGLSMRYKFAMALIDQGDINQGISVLNKLAQENYFDACVMMLLKTFEGVLILSTHNATDYFFKVANSYITIKKLGVPMHNSSLDSFKKLIELVYAYKDGKAGSEKQILAQLLFDRVQSSGITLEQLT